VSDSNVTDATRREFLRMAVAINGALVLGACLPANAAHGHARIGGATSAPSAASTAAAGAAAPVPITAWVRVAPSGAVTLMASQSEMGQGISTTMAAALAHELYLRLESVRIEFAPFAPDYRDRVYNWMFTGNSQGTSSFYEVMRTMGAAAREMLLAAAATRLNVRASSLATQDGIIHHPASGRSVTFGDVATSAAALKVPEKPALRTDAPFEGRSVARWDIPAKVDGSAVFGIDVNVPNMLLAAVRCAPRFGARLARFDAAAIRAQPGVVAVVEVPRGLAVVAKTYWQARRALDTAHVEWSEEGSSLSCSQSLPAVYREKLASGPFFAHKTTGDVDATMARASRRLEAVYEVPFQAHATMEPMNCTAHVTAERCEIWAPTQGMEMSLNVATRTTGLPAERITIHRTLLGAGFGRRLLADFLQQTLLIAQAVQQPVKLIWSREEDMTHDFYRPAMLHEISGAVDTSGAVVSLAHRVVSPSHMLYIVPRAYFPQLEDWTEPAALPEGMDTMAVEGLLDTPYDIPNQRVEQHRLQLDVPVSVWRTTGHGPNNFVLESFIDELAAAAQADPLAFRLAAAKDKPRARAVLELVREKSGWSAKTRAGVGRGVACAAAFGGMTAAVVELSLTDSRVKIHRVVLAVDCGRTLDPGIATSNMLGGIVWGLSGMRTSMAFDAGRAVYTNFNSFEPLALRETPPCEVHFIDSGAPLGGTGELGPVPIHAAVCNAIFASTGRRIRALPLSTYGLLFA
jgi:isoquinoline 1-oxidoreductase beta subunit